MSNLVVLKCYKCGDDFGMSPVTHATARLRGKDFRFYCPNGHPQVFTARDSEADKLRRECDRLKQEQARYEELLAEEREAREAAERRASAARGQVTKLKNRAVAGVCPCCNRTISQLARHMKTKHPEFKAEDIIDLASARKERA